MFPKHRVRVLQALLLILCFDQATAHGTRDIVLACNIKVPVIYIQRMLRSLREVAPEAQVVMVSPARFSPSEEVLSVYREFKAQPLIYDDEPMREKNPSFPDIIHRYYAYRSFLEQNFAAFDKVFISDLDVVFQKNPFDYIEHDIEMFLDEWLISGCYWNSVWMIECLGQRYYNMTALERIACAGTTMGTTAGVAQYLLQMTDHMDQVKCSHIGLDQAVHNYLLYSGTLKARLNDNHSGFLATLHTIKSFRRDRYGRLINGLGTPYAAIHQYNRHDWLIKEIDERYPYKPEHETFTLYYQNDTKTLTQSENPR
mmetsp:Transcript_21202/g.35427  ORF Transcript_21202/g.35427 Transcript_21202/m.35427 type:complete len:313 (-) Transcript_21202:1137-2075(-)